MCCALFLLTMETKSWIEANLVVDGEMAEAVAEVMARFVSGGVVIESTQIADDVEGTGREVGPLRVCGYLPVDDSLEENKQYLLEAMWHLNQICPLPELEFKSVAELDWSQYWKKHFRPIPIGKRLLVTPTWIDIGPHDRTVVKIEPGMAFGTGTHPSTQLCLELLEDLLLDQNMGALADDKSQLSLIDVGCGSGILGIAAAKLGISYVLGVDLDPDAIEAAQKNSLVNDVSNYLDFFVGSLDEIKAGNFRIKQAPLVVANILTPVIKRLFAAGLNDIVAPHGKLILSGILEEQSAEIEAAVQTRGMRLIEKCQNGDWLALIVG
jgi:ribosomal protein L11 methyltransferase